MRLPLPLTLHDPGRALEVHPRLGYPFSVYVHSSIISGGVGLPGEDDSQCISLVAGFDLSALDADSRIKTLVEVPDAPLAQVRDVLEDTPRNALTGRGRNKLKELFSDQGIPERGLSDPLHAWLTALATKIAGQPMEPRWLGTTLKDDRSPPWKSFHGTTNVIDDGFTEGSDLTLSSHTPDTTGTGWTRIQGTPSYTINAAGDYIAASADDNNDQIVYTAQPSPTEADVDVYFDVLQEGAGAQKQVGVTARYAAATNVYGLSINNSAVADMAIQKRVGGTPSNVTSSDTDNVWTGQTIRFQLRGTTLKGFFGATEELSTTDSSHTAAGAFGLHSGDYFLSGGDVDQSWQLDNFLATEESVIASLLKLRSPLLTHITR
jgi:hypothetical protein